MKRHLVPISELLELEARLEGLAVNPGGKIGEGQLLQGIREAKVRLAGYHERFRATHQQPKRCTP
jgi:hypothetical protein